MTERIVVACDRPGCDTHAGSDLSRAAGFIAVSWDGALLDYCSPDCLMMAMAAHSPLERVLRETGDQRP